MDSYDKSVMLWGRGIRILLDVQGAVCISKGPKLPRPTGGPERLQTLVRPVPTAMLESAANVATRQPLHSGLRAGSIRQRGFTTKGWQPKVSSEQDRVMVCSGAPIDQFPRWMYDTCCVFCTWQLGSLGFISRPVCSLANPLLVPR